VVPLLRLNSRLKEGYEQRTLRENTLEKADIWIQAASVGECFLALELIKTISTNRLVRILVTTNTSQGMGIIKEGVNNIKNRVNIKVFAAYFPFDKPSIMEIAVETVNPKIMVLIENELWPGLLFALKKTGCRILVINGRLNKKSLDRYLVWPLLWKTISPDRILAVTEKYAERFGILFGRERVDVMPNMKFDRMAINGTCSHKDQSLDSIIPAGKTFLVLGSTRREEESDIEKIICKLLKRKPDIIIGLFPRHMHRIGYWKAVLKNLDIPWILRSETVSEIADGTVILWDTFGELSLAYKQSTAAFVGGSLAPLGGQNFLEALVCGIIPIIGPSWEDFDWIGGDIVEQGLVRVVSNWSEAADSLTEYLKKPLHHNSVQSKAMRYIKNRQGGTKLASMLIEKHL